LEVQTEQHERKAKQLDQENIALQKQLEETKAAHAAVKAELESTLKSLEDL
jgi:uncharacterized protein YlxW (UPF0749 family)